MPEPLRGLLVDFGGVLTTDLAETWRAVCGELGVPPRVMSGAVAEAYESADADNVIHRLETGESSVEEFNEHLAAMLGERSGVAVPADGLISRLMAGSTLDERVFAAVLAAHRAEVRTGLLSNSWGVSDYPRERFAGLFDAVVISGEVGLRKPDPAIYEHAAGALGLPPAACVFVDDFERNVAAAEAVGMTGLHHRDAAETIPRLSELLGIELPSERSQ